MYKPTIPKTGIYASFVGCLLLFASCVATLAPKFNQTIIDDLSASSTDVFQLLANTSGGTSNTDFTGRNDMYNNVIGKLETLQLEIEARPMPDNKLVNKIIAKANRSLQNKGAPTITAAQTAPSATAIKNILDNITKMKETDAAQGLKAMEVKAFKGNITLFLDQALTYESYLNN